MKEITESWWEQPLSSLTHEQWEMLCDGCGKCCLHKLQDEDSEEVFYTAVACRFLDAEKVRCTCYARRADRNPDCLVISPDNIDSIVEWLPQTCAYRLRYLDKPLPQWHPLRSGSPETVEAYGQSVRHRTISEDSVGDDEDWEELILIDIV